jgi:hypothetical protein
MPRGRKKKRRQKKPLKCPACGSTKIADISYGLPCFYPEKVRQLEAGELIPGGCDIDRGLPLWKCTECGEGMGEFDW